MHKAANYFLNEWDGIEAISHYGDVDWDNNRLERINRHISLSRHNSLFFGSLPESPPGPLGKRIAGHRPKRNAPPPDEAARKCF